MAVIPQKFTSSSGLSTLITPKVAIISLLVVHFFGALGLSYPDTRPYFELATPFNLLLISLLLLFFHQDWNYTFVVFAVLCAVLGFLVEVAGVHTGVIFGDYAYGPTLGFKLWDVPLLIGLNWLVLIYCTGMITYRATPYWVVNAVLGSTLMIVLDIFIEPVAVALDFWQWSNDIIPLQNFIGWFVTAFVLQSLYHLLPFKKGNQIARSVFYVQLAFFITLQFLI